MPDLFAVMAIAAIVHIIIGLLADVGIRQAVIQSNRGNDPVILDTAWTLQILRGLTVWLIACAVALVVGLIGDVGGFPKNSTYADPSLPWVIIGVAFQAVIHGFHSMNGALAGRNLDLKRLTLIGLISQVMAVVVTALLGWLTGSIWAMVIGGGVAPLIATILSHTWLPGRRSVLRWDTDAAKELLGFGRWILASSLLGALAANSDRLILGLWISPTELGVYTIAMTLFMALEGAAFRMFGAVSMPALSEAWRDSPDRFRRVYFKMRLPADVVLIVSAGFIFATGEAVVRILYDERYANAGSILQMLSFGLLLTRYSIAHNSYLAAGKPDYLTSIHVIKLLSMIILVLVGFRFFGVEGAALGVAFHLLPTLPLIWWFNRQFSLNNLRFEIKVLALWPVGYGLGLISRKILYSLT